MSLDLDAPQFTTQELIAAVPGLTHDAFKTWLKRGALHLSVSDEMGRGKRPKYRGVDVIQTGLAYDLARNGAIPLHKLPYVWNLVRGVIIGHQCGLSVWSGAVMLMYVDLVSLELMVSTFTPENPPSDDVMRGPRVPDMLTLFQLGRFLDRMVRRMERVKAGLTADEPSPPPTSGDFAIDEAGRRVLVGLSYDESRELAALLALEAPSDEQSYRRGELDFRHQREKCYRIISQPQPFNEKDWTQLSDGRHTMLGLTAEETDEYCRLSSEDMASRCVERYEPWSSTAERTRKANRCNQLYEKHRRAVGADIETRSREFYRNLNR